MAKKPTRKIVRASIRPNMDIIIALESLNERHSIEIDDVDCHSQSMNYTDSKNNPQNETLVNNPAPSIISDTIDQLNILNQKHNITIDDIVYTKNPHKVDITYTNSNSQTWTFPTTFLPPILKTH